MEKDWVPDIFEFLNFRDFLTAYYEAGRENTRAISYRYLARRAGFSSPGFLRHVMRGERNLGAESIEQLINAIDLEGTEARYFRALVAFNQANSPAEKNEAFEEVAAIRRFRNAPRIDDGLFEYLSHWYYPAIREMVARPDFQEEPSWIAQQLLPAIKTSQARQALESLVRLGLLVRSDEGRLTRADPTLSTEHEVHNLAIGNYHRQMLEQAAGSIERVPRDWRDVAAMTVCISPDTITELKKRVHDFRERLLELCDSDPDPEIVFQINTQLFPLTRIDE